MQDAECKLKPRSPRLEGAGPDASEKHPCLGELRASAPRSAPKGFEGTCPRYDGTVGDIAARFPYRNQVPGEWQGLVRNGRSNGKIFAYLRVSSLNGRKNVAGPPLISRAEAFGRSTGWKADCKIRGPLFAHQIGRSRRAVEKTCAVNESSLESFPLTQKKRSARAGWRRAPLGPPLARSGSE